MMLLAPLLLSLAAGALAQAQYDNCLMLNEGYDFRMLWTINGDTIDFMLQSTLLDGYMASGLYPPGNGMHPNGNNFVDVWAVSYPNGGTPNIQDLNMPEYATLPDGGGVDLDNPTVTRGDKYLTATFSRALVTGDADDLDIVLGQQIAVIMSCNPDVPFAGTNVPQHAGGCYTQQNVDFAVPSTCQPFGGAFTDNGAGFRLEYVLSDARDAVTFTASAPTVGWLGFGWSDGGAAAHINTDMYVGWVADGVPTILDTYSTTVATPAVDAVQNIINPTGDESNGITTISFTRLFDTGDADDVLVRNLEVTLQYGLNDADGTGTTYPKHSSASTGLVNFLEEGNAGNAGPGGPGGPGADAPVPGQYVSPNGDFTLGYAVTPDGNSIEFTVEATTTGWVSFGFGSSNAHIDTDMYVGYVDAVGTVTVLDTYSTSLSQPLTDPVQDVVVGTGSELNGVTTFTFTRPLVTADLGNDKDITDSSTTLQWAYAQDDSPAVKHNVAGTGQVNFFSDAVIKDDAMFDHAGDAIGYTVGFILIIYLAARWLHILQKALASKTVEGELSDEPLKQGLLGNGNGNGGYQQPGYGGSYQDPTAPGGGFYRGSMRVGYNQEQQSYYPAQGGGYDVEQGQPLTRMASSSSVSSVRPRSRSNAKPIPQASSMAHKLTHNRVPGTQVAYIDAIVGLVYVFINLLWIFPLAGDTWAVEDSFGYAAVANGFFVALPATRNSVLVYLLGMPFDRTIMYHRWLGRWMTFLAFVHMCGYWKLWDDAGLDIMKLSFQGTNKQGMFSFFALVFVTVTSLEFVRRKHFESFYFTHFAFFLVYIFGCLHTSQFKPFALAALFFYMMDRAIRVFWGIVPRRTREIQLKPGNVVMLRFTKHRMAKYRPGQYVFLNIPGLSFFEWHPFSLSNGADEDLLEVHIKSLGDHTAKLVEAATLNQQMTVRVDGPYGRPSLNYKRYPSILMVGGGVGITPLISLLRTIYQVNVSDEVRMQRPRSPHIRNVYLVWACSTHQVYGWFRDIIEECQALGKRTDFPNFTPMVYLSKQDRSDDPNTRCGRPDLPRIYDHIQAEAKGQGIRCAVFACGPSELVNDSWDEAIGRSVGSTRFDHHTETFEF